MNYPVRPREKSAELINTALTNLQQVGGPQDGPESLQVLLKATQIQTQLATASALLAIADAIEQSGQRIETATLMVADQVKRGQR